MTPRGVVTNIDDIIEGAYLVSDQLQEQTDVARIGTNSQISCDGRRKGMPLNVPFSMRTISVKGTKHVSLLHIDRHSLCVFFTFVQEKQEELRQGKQKRKYVRKPKLADVTNLQGKFISKHHGKTSSFTCL